MKKYIEIGGRKKAVYFDFGDRTLCFSGKKNKPQYVPQLYNRQDYGYSHGGSLFQAACEKFWDMEKEMLENTKKIHKKGELEIEPLTKEELTTKVSYKGEKVSLDTLIRRYHETRDEMLWVALVRRYGLRAEFPEYKGVRGND